MPGALSAFARLFPHRRPRERIAVTRAAFGLSLRPIEGRAFALSFLERGAPAVPTRASETGPRRQTFGFGEVARLQPCFNLLPGRPVNRNGLRQCLARAVKRAGRQIPLGLLPQAGHLRIRGCQRPELTAAGPLIVAPGLLVALSPKRFTARNQCRRKGRPHIRIEAAHGPSRLRVSR
jgi:hypothetical protein